MEALFINIKIHCCITTEQLAKWNKIMLKIITPKLYCSYLNNSFYSRRLGKESLNSDGPRFHQYLQNGQPPLILTNWTQNYHDMTLEFLVLAWESHKNVPNPHLENKISYGNKNLHRFTSTPKDHIQSQKWMTT